MSELEEQIKVVVGARIHSQVMVDKKKAMYDEFISLHTDYFSDVATAQTITEEAEDKLRWLTLKAYVETGDKKPAPGVGIREVTKYAYNGKEALSWAIEHKMALKLDEAKFKNHVKADPPDFVSITTEPQATISANLTI